MLLPSMNGENGLTYARRRCIPRLGRLLDRRMHHGDDFVGWTLSKLTYSKRLTGA